MSRASDRIAEFNEAFDISPASTVWQTAHRRLLQHRQEFDELEEVLALGAEDRQDIDREHLARELADNVVVAYGTAAMYGIDLDRAFEIVMDANMAKLPECERCHGTTLEPVVVGRGQCTRCGGTGKGKPAKDKHGKVLKPVGWVEPNLAPAVVR